MDFDLAEMLRRRNLFGDPSASGVGLMNSPSGISQEDMENTDTTVPEQPKGKNKLSLEDRLKFLYGNEEGPATKKYREYLDTKPVDEGPGKLARTGAILSGMAESVRDPSRGAETTRALMDAPYQAKYKQWLQGGTGLEKGAELEEKSGKDKIQLLKQMMDEDKQGTKDERQAKLDESTINRNNSTIDLHKAQISNYQNLKEDREKKGWTFHENKANGHLIGINPNLPEGQQTKDYGVTELTPQEKADLQVNTFGKEEGMRQAGRKSLFDYTQPQRVQGAIETHQANRDYDVNNPLTVKAPRDSYVSPNQQRDAEKQAAIEINRDNKGGYKNYFSDEQKGEIHPASKFRGTEYEEDYNKFLTEVKARANEILNKTRVPSVKPPSNNRTDNRAGAPVTTTPKGRTISLPPEQQE